MIRAVSSVGKDLKALEHELGTAESDVFEPATLRQRIIRIAVWLLIIAIALGVLHIVGVNPFGWVRRVFALMGEIDTKYLVAGMTFQTFNLVLVGFSYVAIWRSAYPEARKIPVAQIITCFVVGIALNDVLPMSMGSIVMLFMFLAIIPGATAAGMASGFGVSNIFFFTMGVITYAFLFFTISGALSQAVGGIQNHLPALVTILIAVVIAVVILFKMFRQKVENSLKNLKQGAAIMRTPRVLILLVLLPQALGYSCQIITTAAFMRGYDIPVSLGNIILNNAANSIATLTAVTPGGVGATQGLTTIALSGVATPAQIASYSLAQQLILTAWTCVVAAVMVVVFFGWSGGKQIVTNSLVSARSQMKEKHAEGKEAKAEKKAAKHAAGGATAPSADDVAAGPPDSD